MKKVFSPMTCVSCKKSCTHGVILPFGIMCYTCRMKHNCPQFLEIPRPSLVLPDLPQRYFDFY